MPAEIPLVYAIVEDDPAMRRLIGAIVRAGGDVVIEATDYAHAEVLLREYPWDVAIIDRALPDGDGMALCALFEPPPESHRAIVIVSEQGSSEDKMSGFDAGADEYISKPFDPPELRSRLRAIGRRVHGQREILARVATLEQMSMIDGMTRVYNHRFFENELRRLHQTATLHKRPLSLIMLDIDFFKRVNDTYGHRAGDRVLIEVSTIVASTVRSVDVLARYGGEEFAVILPETELAEAIVLAENIRRAVESASIDVGVAELCVTVSGGVADRTCLGSDSPGGFVEAADRALYAAKESGRNRVMVQQAPMLSVSPPRATQRTPEISGGDAGVLRA